MQLETLQLSGGKSPTISRLTKRQGHKALLANGFTQCVNPMYYSNADATQFAHFNSRLNYWIIESCTK
jgi:glutamine amidotransferase PdxT